jgi:hypothetical protein
MFSEYAKFAPNTKSCSNCFEMLAKKDAANISPTLRSTRAIPPCSQSFLFLVCFFFSLGEEADSVLDGIDAVSNQRQDDKHDEDNDEDDKVSCNHDACGSGW